MGKYVTEWKIGDKVKFARLNAGHDWQKQKIEKELTLGEVYMISDIEVGGYSSSVWLKERPGIQFNSVFFEVEQPTKED